MDPFNFLKSLFGKQKSTPSEFPRSVKVTDDKSLLRMTEIRSKNKEINKLIDQVDLIKKERDAIQARLFHDLEALHPEIRTSETVQTRFIFHEGDYYYVAEDKADGPQIIQLGEP